MCGTIHLAQIRTGLSTGIQLGQGKRVIFTLKEALPVQADGEPWLQQPASMEVTLHNKTKMLQRVAPPSMLGQIMSPSNWFKGKKKGGSAARKASVDNEFGVDVEAPLLQQQPQQPQQQGEEGAVGSRSPAGSRRSPAASRRSPASSRRSPATTPKGKRRRGKEKESEKEDIVKEGTPEGKGQN